MKKIKFSKDNIEALNGISQLAKSLSPNASIINLILRQPTVLFSNCFIFTLNYWLISNSVDLEVFLKSSLEDFRQHHKPNDNSMKSKEDKIDGQGISSDDELFQSDNENENDYIKYNTDIYKDDDDDDDIDNNNDDNLEDDLITKIGNKKKLTKLGEDSDESLDDTDIINVDVDDDLFNYGDDVINSDTTISMPDALLGNKNQMELNNLILKEKSKKIKSENKDYYTSAEIKIVLDNIRQWRNNLNQIKKNLIALKRSELELQAYNLFNNLELITSIKLLISEFSLESYFNDLFLEDDDIAKMDEIIESDDSDSDVFTSTNKKKRRTIPSDSE